MTVTFCNLSKPLPSNGLCNIFGASAAGAHLYWSQGGWADCTTLSSVAADESEGREGKDNSNRYRRLEATQGESEWAQLSEPQHKGGEWRVRGRERRFIRVSHTSTAELQEYWKENINRSWLSLGYCWSFLGQNPAGWAAFYQSSMDERMEIWKYSQISQGAHHVLGWCHNKTHPYWGKKKKTQIILDMLFQSNSGKHFT